MSAELREQIADYIRKLKQDFGIRIEHKENTLSRTNFNSLISATGFKFLNNVTLEETLKCVKEMHEKNASVKLKLKKVSRSEFEAMQNKVRKNIKTKPKQEALI